jgi:GNAT superfamily N-acetyltransferase
MKINIPEIIQYEPALKPEFKRLNYEWLNKYFFVTAEDDKMLSDPEKIIRDGGCILFARIRENIVGTCALIKVSPEEYEVAKMAVTEMEQGKKIGHLLMNAIINEARNRSARIISLETAKPLKAAIALYQKFGFLPTTEERIHTIFGRTTFRMELKV